MYMEVFRDGEVLLEILVLPEEVGGCVVHRSNKWLQGDHGCQGGGGIPTRSSLIQHMCKAL